MENHIRVFSSQVVAKAQTHERQIRECKRKEKRVRYENNQLYPGHSEDADG